MDALFTSVCRLYESGTVSVKAIAHRLNVSAAKVRQILITAGHISTEESRLQQDGLSVDEIAAALGKTRKAVLARLPYSKGQYNAEYPTLNALRIRACRSGERIRTEAAEAVCPECGKAFTPVRGSRYCGTDCFKASRRRQSAECKRRSRQTK